MTQGTIAPRRRKGQCGFVTPAEKLSANDRAEIEKFKQYLSARAGEEVES